MQRPPTDYIMWRFAENDDRESLGLKTDELLMDEATARASKWCIDSVSGNDRRRTDPKETPRTRQDESGAVVPDAICTFEWKVEW